MKSGHARKGLTPQEASVLVVEDQIDSYTTIARLLASSGVLHSNSLWKISGAGVVQFAASLPPIDLILLDIGLPSENGFDVLKDIRATPSFAKTRVVAVTGHIDQMEQAKAAGFDGFLGKPLDADRFPGQLARILGGGSVWER